MPEPTQNSTVRQRKYQNSVRRHAICCLHLVFSILENIVFICDVDGLRVCSAKKLRWVGARFVLLNSYLIDKINKFYATPLNLFIYHYSDILAH